MNFRRSEMVLCLLAGACLFFLLLPVIGGTPALQQRICAEHLRKLRVYAALYENDHRGAFPPVIAPGKRRLQYWPDFLRPYVKDFKAFACPADPHGGGELLAEEEDLLPVPYNLRYVSFGMNYWLGSNITHNPKHRYPYNIHRVKTPGYVIYLGDSATLELRPTSCWKLDYLPVHDKGANFLFVDGHVERLTQEKLGFTPGKWKIDRERWTNWTAR